MNGLWTAEFGSSAGMVGGGVTVFRDGSILGGDGTYYYVGNYELLGNKFKATLRVSPFIEGAESVFRTVGKDLMLELSGSLTGERTAVAQGRAMELPSLVFGVKLTKRA